MSFHPESISRSYSIPVTTFSSLARVIPKILKEKKGAFAKKKKKVMNMRKFIYWDIHMQLRDMRESKALYYSFCSPSLSWDS